MRVFYFITKSEQGGAQSVVYELLKGHKKAGDVVVVMASGKGWLAQKTEEIGYEYIENVHMKKTYNPLVLFRALRLYKRFVSLFKPDLISCHSSFSGFIGRVGLSNKYNVIYTAHGWGFTKGTPLARKIIAICAEWFAGMFCKKIICVSNFDRDQAVKYHIAPKRKITVIRNGVDVVSHRKNARDNKIVFLGRFARPKRQDLVLMAYSMLPDSFRQEYKMVFVGDGPQLKEVKRMTRDKSIVFAGAASRNEALDILSTASCAILISDWEGLPMVVLEALQLGMPVIANNVGGISEAVDEKVGILLRSNPNAADISEAMARILSNKEIWNALHEEALRRSEFFSAERMIRETLALHKKYE